MKVDLLIKTGPPSSPNPIQELIWLHDQNVSFDTEEEETWESAIYKAFRRTIDSKRFYVRRVRNPHGNGEPPHSLKEKVKVLMLSEFNRLIRKSYTVQIMEFDEEVTLASVGAGVKAGQKRQIQNDDTFLMPSRPSPQQRTEQDIRMPVLQPFVDNGHVEEDDDDADEDGDPISPQVKRVKLHHNIQAQGQRQGASTSAIARIRRVPPPPTSSASTSSSANKGKGSRPEAEAFKEKFYRTVKNDISNAQLLKARHSLQQLKKTDQWTKWVLRSPFVTSVMRTLFDV